MNIIHIFGIAILLMEGTDNHVLQEEHDVKTIKEQRILLRKLQNFQDTRNETKALTWNEVLADVLVNRIKIFSLKQEKEALSEDVEIEKNALTTFFGHILVIYKKFVYDKIYKHKIQSNNLEFHTTNFNKSDANSGEETPNTFQDTLVNNDLNSTDPKAEIEIIEPRYHGKIASEGVIEVPMEEDKEAKAPECPDGFIKGENGCVNGNSKLILAIPNQCPIGYRRDRLGFCRMVF